MQNPISVNSRDISNIVTRYGYMVSYTRVDGGSGGTMLDGSTTVDVIAVKAIITVPLMPLMESQLNSLLDSLYANDYVTVTYYDPRANATRTIQCIMTEDVESKHAGQNAFSNEIWLSGVLTFTER